MNILLITNDWKPKTGGISTYLRSLVENLDHKFFIYGPSWIEGNDAYPAADTFIINPRKVFEDIQKIVSHLKIDVPVYKFNELPEALKSVPITIPGSRFIK